LGVICFGIIIALVQVPIDARVSVFPRLQGLLETSAVESGLAKDVRDVEAGQLRWSFRCCENRPFCRIFGIAFLVVCKEFNCQITRTLSQISQCYENSDESNIPSYTLCRGK
jgi:hypothetical protein